MLVKTDVKNAHNSFPKDGAQKTCQKKIIEAANADSRLMPLAVAGASILRLATPIYMRDSTSQTKFDFLCNGLMGGGQRQGAERLQALPALLIAAGLLIARAASYGRHRQRLLRAVKELESGPQ